MHRILFSVGTYAIYSFGVLVALGVAAGSLLAARLAPRAGLTREQALEGIVGVVILGVLFARLAYVAQEFPWFATHPIEILNFRGGGMSWHGGILGTLLGVWLAARRGDIRMADLLDTYAAPLMLGLAVGRIGCFLNGCCYGRVCHLPWAVIFPDPELHHLPRHPTQVYEMVLALMMVGILVAWLRRRAFSGEVFAAFLVLYSLVRFTVEFFRDSTLLAGGLSLAQYVSLLLMGGGLSFIAWRRGSRPASQAPPRRTAGRRCSSESAP